MKRLTLDETWVLCLRMWKWIARQAEKGRTDVTTLKIEWLENHGYHCAKLKSGCFFCEYAQSSFPAACDCPAKEISPKFRCDAITYDYYGKPVKFYAKLVELNKKRLSKKRKC